MRRDDRPAVLRRSTSTPRSTCCAASSSRRWRGRPTRRARRWRRRWPSSTGTGWPRPRWRWPCSTPSCAPRGGRSPASSAPCTTACRAASRSGSWTRSANCSTRSSGYLDEGYLRIKLKIEPGWDVEPVRAVRERFGDDVLLQVDANTAYTLARRPAPGAARPVRPAADRAAARRGGHPRPRRPGQPAQDAGLPRRVDHLGPRGGRGHPPRRLLDRQHQARPGRRLPRGAPDPRRLRRPTASRSGAAACSRPASAGPPTSRWPRCPASRCPATPPARPLLPPPTSPTPFVLDDGHLAVPTGPGLGVDPLPDELAAVTTSTEWLPL